MNGPKRTTRLRRLVERPELTFLMEAHDGVSARIAEEAGFPGIWASGLAISAALGVRDSNEASWTQVLEVAEFMADAADVPILLDGDTGFGDFNNVRRVVRKLVQRGVAGICIEDKRFPKRNSFADGAAHALAPVDEFCGKIRAGRDAAPDDDFVVVARTEAFIAGCGVETALRRAEAYRQAGADALLVHSRRSVPDEVFRFLDAWEGRAPVILVPTRYFATPADAFRERGVSVVIWANHLLRAAIRAMQETASKIREEEGVAGVEDDIASLEEVFRLQGDQELRDAERRYRASRSDDHTAVVLAATRGEALGELTREVPKTMLPVGGRPILERSVSNLREWGVNRVRVVVGYAPDRVQVDGAEPVENPHWADTDEVASLDVGLEGVEGPALVLFGDVVYRSYLLGILLGDPADAVVLGDASLGPAGDGRASDYLVASRPDSEAGLVEGATLVRAFTGHPTAEVHAEWPGLMKLSARGVRETRRWFDEVRDAPAFASLQLTDLLNALADRDVAVRVRYVRGHWADVDRLVDLDDAGSV